MVERHAWIMWRTEGTNRAESIDAGEYDTKAEAIRQGELQTQWYRDYACYKGVNKLQVYWNNELVFESAPYPIEGV